MSQNLYVVNEVATMEAGGEESPRNSLFKDGNLNEICLLCLFHELIHICSVVFAGYA